MEDPLSEWVGAHSDEFDVIAHERSADAEMLGRALEIVKQFIVERKLILYGGQAIDFALRLKGSGIYPDHQIPDYDFFSPQSVDDAYDLADRLAAAGFPHISAIPAIHMQTMRVGTNFVYVADISYVPAEVYEKLPTVSYAGMRVLHPDYQRTDMHLAFCFPYSNPPREDIFHRFRKDLKRFNLFEEYYPIAAEAAGDAELKPVSAEVSLDRAAIHGFAAYAVLQQAYAELYSAAQGVGVAKTVLKSANARLTNIPSIPVTAEHGDEGRVAISFEAPVERLALVSPWPDEVVDALTHDSASVEWFAPYMDTRPLMGRVSTPGSPDIDVYSTRNRLITVSTISVQGVKLRMVTPQYLLLDLLFEAMTAEEPRMRETFRRYYSSVLALLASGGEIIAAMHQEGSGSVSEEVYIKFVESSPFGFPAQTIGDSNHDAAYFILLSNAARKVGDTPPGVDPDNLPDPKNIPERYFPGQKHKAGEHPPFDYAGNPAFQRGGQPIRPPKIEHSAALQIGGSGSMAAVPSKTYVVLFEELDPEVLANVLKDDKSATWTNISVEEAIERNYADLVIVDGKFNWDKRLWRFRCGMKSRLQADIITNKIDLHERISSQYPEAVPSTVIVPTKRLRPTPPIIPGIGPDAPWIWRPEGGFSGRGVHVLDSQRALDRVWASHFRRPTAKRAVLTRYITNPATVTVDGTPRKFHLRLYFVVVAGPDGKRAGLYRLGEIAHARKEYRAGEYSDFEIHDTHFDWSEELLFPRDYPGGPGPAADVTRQAIEILSQVSELTINEIEPFDECDSGFEIFGCDFMVDDAGRVYLIEINFKPGYGLPTAGDSQAELHREWISETLFRGIDEFVLDYEGDDNSEAPDKYVQLCYQAPPQPGGDARTYFLDITDLDQRVFANEALRRGWRRVPYQRAKHMTDLTLAFFMGELVSYDREAWAIKAQIKSRLDAAAITNKKRLHTAMAGSAYLPPTVMLAPGQRSRPVHPGTGEWIFRPEKGFAGRGIAIVSSQKDLDAAWRSHTRAHPRESGLLTRYIGAPKLYPFEGKDYKFHLRLWLLAVVGADGARRLGLYRLGEIILAAAPYEAGSFGNAKIHDTHFSTAVTAGLAYPADYPGDADVLTPKLIEIFREVGEKTLAKVNTYPESPSAFEIFGADVLVDADDHPWLIEVNNVPGLIRALTSSRAHVDEVSECLFRGVWEFAIDPILDQEPVAHTAVAQCYPPLDL